MQCSGDHDFKTQNGEDPHCDSISGAELFSRLTNTTNHNELTDETKALLNL
jgi:hypothetical protein